MNLHTTQDAYTEAIATLSAEASRVQRGDGSLEQLAVLEMAAVRCSLDLIQLESEVRVSIIIMIIIP